MGGGPEARGQRSEVRGLRSEDRGQGWKMEGRRPGRSESRRGWVGGSQSFSFLFLFIFRPAPREKEERERCWSGAGRAERPYVSISARNQVCDRIPDFSPLMCGFPAIRPSGPPPCRRAAGPVVEGGGIKVGAIRPDEGVAFGIEPHGSKEFLFSQGTEKLAAEHGQKVNFLDRSVVEAHSQARFEEASRKHRERFRHPRLRPSANRGRTAGVRAAGPTP